MQKKEDMKLVKKDLFTKTYLALQHKIMGYLEFSDIIQFSKVSSYSNKLCKGINPYTGDYLYIRRDLAYRQLIHDSTVIGLVSRLNYYRELRKFRYFVRNYFYKEYDHLYRLRMLKNDVMVMMACSFSSVHVDRSLLSERISFIRI